MKKYTMTVSEYLSRKPLLPEQVNEFLDEAKKNQAFMEVIRRTNDTEAMDSLDYDEREEVSLQISGFMADFLRRKRLKPQGMEQLRQAINLHLKRAKDNK